MEKRSDRHIRDLVAHTAFKGLDANEIGCARISVMAGGNCSLQRHLRRSAHPSSDWKLRNPIIGIAGSCARLATGHSGRTGEQRDDLPPSNHSITSSARASTIGGTSRPRALAVFRLITISYFVGTCTGRSAGFSPLRMRST